jgi:hypothetical protein
MKRILIMVTLALFLLTFIKGSQGLENKQERAAIDGLNKVLDAQLQSRLEVLSIGAELSAGISDW